mmetsp:Transcript_24106/g.62655  ORF Transcript_24106/g.62655 Transcript_24106/m.62655 type:complete len:317 (+) Transcript_24106:762-1712(+)
MHRDRYVLVDAEAHEHLCVLLLAVNAAFLQAACVPARGAHLLQASRCRGVAGQVLAAPAAAVFGRGCRGRRARRFHLGGHRLARPRLPYAGVLLELVRHHQAVFLLVLKQRVAGKVLPGQHGAAVQVRVRHVGGLLHQAVGALAERAGVRGVHADLHGIGRALAVWLARHLLAHLLELERFHRLGLLGAVDDCGGLLHLDLFLLRHRLRHRRGGRLLFLLLLGGHLLHPVCEAHLLPRRRSGRHHDVLRRRAGVHRGALAGGVGAAATATRAARGGGRAAGAATAAEHLRARRDRGRVLDALAALACQVHLVAGDG